MGLFTLPVVQTVCGVRATQRGWRREIFPHAQSRAEVKNK